MYAWVPGGMQIVLIVAIVLILFGAKKIPELAKGLGLGIKEFKKAAREVTDEVQNAADDKPAQQKSVASVTNAQAPEQTVSQSSNPPKV
ncbi:MAG: Sec-independent protein translocase subunit TatA/TatB [Limisphaerales bacterium]